MPGGQMVGLRRRKHAVLLTLLVVALAIDTVHAQSGTELLRTDAVRTVLGIAIWIVVFERPRERATMSAVLLASLAINWGQHFTAASLDYALSLADQVVLTLFLWSAVYVILRDLFRAPAGGAENVLGAICGYLIAGNAWGHMNAIAYLLVPSAYSINPEFGRVSPRLARPDGTVHVLRLRTSDDDRLFGRDTGTRAGNDVEPIRGLVRSVLYRCRRVTVRRVGAETQALRCRSSKLGYPRAVIDVRQLGFVPYRRLWILHPECQVLGELSDASRPTQRSNA